MSNAPPHSPSAPPIAPPIDWAISPKPVSYPDAVSFMEARVADIAQGRASDLVWLLEHPPLFTAGTSAKEADLLTPDRFPVFKSGRGGQFTYHGPGQRVAYLMLNLKKHGSDVRCFVQNLEHWLINTLAHFNVLGEIREGRVGVWVKRPDLPPINQSAREDKIAALGIRVRKWVSFHGISLNVNPTLEHFSGIVPCGITDQGITSLEDLQVNANMEDIDQVLRQEFEKIFGQTSLAKAPGFT